MKTIIAFIVTALIATCAVVADAETTIKVMAIDSIKADQCLTTDQRNSALVVLTDLRAGFQWIMEPWAFVIFAQGTSLVFQKSGTGVTLKLYEVVNFDNHTIDGWARYGTCV